MNDRIPLRVWALFLGISLLMFVLMVSLSGPAGN